MLLLTGDWYELQMVVIDDGSGGDFDVTGDDSVEELDVIGDDSVEELDVIV